MDALKVTI
jgi:trehalose utilization protein